VTASPREAAWAKALRPPSGASRGLAGNFQFLDGVLVLGPLPYRIGLVEKKHKRLERGIDGAVFLDNKLGDVPDRPQIEAARFAGINSDVWKPTKPLFIGGVTPAGTMMIWSYFATSRLRCAMDAPVSFTQV